MIFLSNDPLKMYDKKSGTTFLIKQPTDEVLEWLDAVSDTFPADLEERRELLRVNRKELSRWLSEHVNVILFGWQADQATTSTVPEFPGDGNPARFLPRPVKSAIVNAFYQAMSLDEIEIKN